MVLPVLLAVLTVVAACILAIFTVIDAGVAVVVFVVVVSRVPLAAGGAELRDHVEGLRVSIELAEADRRRFLQSPEGALCTRVSTTDRAEVLALNEKLLPYSVLFSLEKRWAEEIGRSCERYATAVVLRLGHIQRGDLRDRDQLAVELDKQRILRHRVEQLGQWLRRRRLVWWRWRWRWWRRAVTCSRQAADTPQSSSGCR